MFTMAENSMFQSRMQEILSEHPCHQPQTGPTEILPGVYLGSYRDASNIPKLNLLGISHVVNCAALSCRCPYNEYSGIYGYKEIEANDVEDYDMMQHFPDVKAFIDEARDQGGKVLIHCAMGINRSGLIYVAYMMIEQQMDLLQVVRLVKDQRRHLLANHSFQRQLVQFARQQGLLYAKE